MVLTQGGINYLHGEDAACPHLYKIHLSPSGPFSLRSGAFQVTLLVEAVLTHVGVDYLHGEYAACPHLYTIHPHLVLFSFFLAPTQD